jgi:hypothetical protein
MSKSKYLLASCLVAAFMTTSAFALGVPDSPKPKKEKKKATKEEAKTEEVKPAETKPAEAQPADAKPAAPVAMRTVKLPKSAWENGGFASAKVGDWVEYEYTAMAGMKSRQEIVELGDHTVTTLTKMTVAGQTNESKVQSIYSEPDPAAENAPDGKQKFEVKKVDDKATVGGKEYPAVRYETYADGKLSAKSWIAKDLPLGGMVKTEGPDGKAYLIMSAFGRK